MAADPEQRATYEEKDDVDDKVIKWEVFEKNGLPEGDNTETQFKLMYTNIDGLFEGDDANDHGHKQMTIIKKKKLKEVVERLKPDAVALVETLLFDGETYELPGYKPEHLPASITGTQTKFQAAGGFRGISLYVHGDYVLSEVKKSKKYQIAYIRGVIKNNNKALDVTVVYRKQDENKTVSETDFDTSWNNYFEIEGVQRLDQSIIIGDMNLDLIKEPIFKDRYLESMKGKGYKQYIKCITNFIKNDTPSNEIGLAEKMWDISNNPSLIDHVWAKGVDDQKTVVWIIRKPFNKPKAPLGDHCIFVVFLKLDGSEDTDTPFKPDGSEDTETLVQKMTPWKLTEEV